MKIILQPLYSHLPFSLNTPVMFLDKKDSKSPVRPLYFICSDDIWKSLKKGTVAFEMYCRRLKGICSAQLLYHKDIGSGCPNQHPHRSRKSLTECSVQIREHCPIYQGIMKHATRCKVLIVLRLFATLSLYYQERQLSWNDSLEVIWKKKHVTFWFWHHRRMSVSHETILDIKCFLLKTLVHLECFIFSRTKGKPYSQERRWMAKSIVCVCTCWQCIAKLKIFLQMC